MDSFNPIPPIQPGLPVPAPSARVQRIDRDQQQERARDDQESPSDDADEQAFEEEFSEAYEQTRREPGTATPDAYRTQPPPERPSVWNPRLRRDRRTSRDDDDEPGGDEPGPHIDIVA